MAVQATHVIRKDTLQSFVNAAAVAFRQVAASGASQAACQKVFTALQTPSLQSTDSGSRLPACAYLASALTIEPKRDEQRLLIERFKDIEPNLRWRPKQPYDRNTASSNFPHGHANAMILGPGGIEERRDVWLGVSLLAPQVRYPDHSHDPEEVYLVLSDGEFRQGDDEWFSPGVGGTLYNHPGITHAMRSSNVPLFVFWALPAD